MTATITALARKERSRRASLVERARQQNVRYVRRSYTDDEIALAIAWASGEVGYAAVAKVMKMRGSTTYGFLAKALQHAHSKGLLKVLRV